MGALKDSTFAGSVIIGGSLTFSGASRTVNLNTGITSLLLPGGLDLATVAPSTLIGRASSGSLAALTALPAVSGALVTALNATQLTSGTIPDARFPVLLPFACKIVADQITSGTIPDDRFPSNLPDTVGVNASTNLVAGTIPDARFPAQLPAIGGVNLTSLNASSLDSGTIPDARFAGTLPAVSGANLTALNAAALNAGTIPDARFPSTLPETVGINATTNLVAGTIPAAIFPSVLPAISGASLTGITTAQIGGLATGVVAFLATPSSANFRTMITDESGTGALLFAGGALGAPASGLLSNCTGLPVSTGISGLASGVAAFLSTPSSANFRTMITDESGTGALLFAGGALGTPLSGLLTNCTGPNLTGHITSVGNNTSLGSFTLAQLSAAVSNANIARTDAAQTFAGTQTVNGDLILSGANHTIEATGDVLITSDHATLNCASAVNFATPSFNASLSAGCTMISPAFSFAGTTSAASITVTDSGGLVEVVATSFLINGNEVADLSSAQALTGKTYNGLTISGSTPGTLNIGTGSTLATSGAFSTTLTSTATTNVTLPTTGTLSTLAGSETITNKKFTTCKFITAQNSQSGNYTIALTDASRQVYYPVGAGAGNTFTLPSNASVAFDIGTTIEIVNDSLNAITLAINADTMVLSPGGATGSRTLAAAGIATARKVTSTRWMISGTGLT